jgi:quercetin dioxygenase-like cupin family protein
MVTEYREPGTEYRVKTAAMIAAVLLCAALAAGQEAVPVEQEPHHKLVLENEYVRVWRVEVPRGGFVKRHVHQGAFLQISSGSECLDGTKLRDCTVTLTEPEVESAIGVGHHGSTRWLEVDLKRPLGELECGVARVQRLHSCPPKVDVTATSHAGVHRRSTKLAAVRLVAEEQELSVGGETELHEHTAPHLVVAVSDLRLRSEAPVGEPQQIAAAAGDVQWVPAGVKHKLTNVGDRPARWITLEFK